MNTLIASKTFTASMYYEGSWGSRPAGSHSSTMELHKNKLGQYYIEWDIPELDENYCIGLEVEGTDVVGYDGIFSLPEQAIELLKANGFNTSDVE